MSALHDIEAGQLIAVDWIKPELMCAITGYTKKAMDNKRESGRWPRGLVWDKVEGEIFYSIAGYRKWVEQNRSYRLECEPRATEYNSTSCGMESDTSPRCKPPRRRRTSHLQDVSVLR